MTGRVVAITAHPFRALIVPLLIATVALPSRADQVETVRPESVGLSSQRLERMTERLQRLIEDNRMAGAVTLVARRGKVAWLNAAGWQDRENKIPMKTDTIFRIASMTKPVTSVAVMMLYEEGHFRLDDPVAKFIPDLKEMQVIQTTADGQDEVVRAQRPITIHHLLTHTSGLTYPWDQKVGAKYYELGITHGLIEDPDTIGDSVKNLAKVPLIHQPGERFTYGLNTDVLGYLVEVVSGKTLDEVLRARLFEPLGMVDTQFFLKDGQASRLAKVYRSDSDGKALLETRDEIAESKHFRYTTAYPCNSTGRYFSGGGGLCSTASDYYRFCQMLLDKGRVGTKRLMSRKTIELMTAPHVKYPGRESDESGFGLGFGVAGSPGGSHEVGSKGTFSWGGFFYTTFFIDPQEELIAISLAQLHPAINVDWNEQFRNLVYQAIDD
jgi:CubicO group peptidase (beta-lactamase class C family)